MSDRPPSEEPRRGGVIDPAAYNHVMVRMRDLNARATWLPYFERLLLVGWLLVFCLAMQSIIDMPFNGLGQLITAGLWIWVVLLGMGVALRRAGGRIAVTYRERVRRRRITFVVGSLGAVFWILFVKLAMS
ncbi:MAG: hypothetical protein GYB66_12795 [Chloroflexi bacterium]|nr:hypothetical protein [Chloroflexota bacterium]